jgi:hypothetical protein
MCVFEISDQTSQGQIDKGQQRRDARHEYLPWIRSVAALKYPTYYITNSTDLSPMLSVARFPPRWVNIDTVEYHLEYGVIIQQYTRAPRLWDR